ncbi:AAA family ATPase [Fictibacillus terranigra]|uniref:Nuclease SbcCD subunit C n=1 Tax=Fictibacillus terranigra TaxID=3058424 RepID=A0ABT8ED45_9BACL|nr:AAA family ATPase [Fictibacillus sp. CENA-BCM004]MDN4075853.1 AAA family ATPase [Fictibacillus sp. CENA-BCM004]
MSNGFLIKKIYIKNFRGYSEKTFAFFEAKKENRGLILLSGSNGYGKTSLLDAIEWCFTGTIHRLKEDFYARKDKKSAKLKKCLIRHNGHREDVVVEIHVIYRGEELNIKRVFKKEDESLAFEPDNSDFLVNGKNLNAQKNIDYVLDEPIAKDFYERYTCSYEKNLRVYEKSRENIYDMFSSFFGGTKDIETIINNLDGDKKNKKIKGIIDQLDFKIKTENVPDYQKKKEKYEEAAEELNNLLNVKQGSDMDQSDSLSYPNHFYFKDEVVPESIIASEANLEEKVKDLKKQRVYIQNIKIIKNKFSVINLANQYKENLEKQKEHDDFILRIYRPFQELKQEIISIQGKTTEVIEDEKQEYRSYQRELLKASKSSIEGIKVLKELSTKINGIDDEQIRKFQSVDFLLKECHSFEEKLKGFSTADDELNALRAIVDHKPGFEIHRNKGFKECPLCGSEENFANENVILTKIAKDILGEIDTKRNELQLKINECQKEINSIFQFFYRYLSITFTKKLDELDNSTRNFEMANEFIKYCNLYQLNFHHVDEHKLKQKKSDLENNLLKTEEFIALEEKIMNDLADENEELFGMMSKHGRNLKREEFQLLDTNGKIYGIQLFLKEYLKVKEAFPVTMNLEEINQMDIENKILILDNWILHIETDEALKLKRKQVLALEQSYKESEGVRLQKEKELEKLKEVLKELKHLRNHWDKKMVESIKEPLQKIYRRINRHTNIQDINLLIEGKTTPMASLNANVNDEEVPATNILSAGQLSVMALAIFLTISMGQKDNEFKCFFLDDPIQTMDDLNILSFIDLLRTELAETNKDNRFIDQLFFTTCDENLERLITHKMNSFGVNYTHIHFNGYGDSAVLV